MKIALCLYDEMTALDAIGPYEVLARLPGAELSTVGRQRGPVRCDTGRLGLVADLALDELTAPDVLLMPGGPGSRALERDELWLAWLRSAHERATWTTSVCTGALVLGAAGLLEGRRATTHWAQLDRLREFGAEPVSERAVQSGDVYTAAGVSAGIDMALALAARLVNEDVARMLQLGIEYDPAPPFDAGSPERVAAPLVEAVRSALAAGAG